MSEDTSTAGASEGHQTDAGASTSGSPSEGSTSTSQAGADSFATERESYEARVRAEQSRADKAEAALRQAQAGSSSTRSRESESSGLTAEEMRREMRAEFARTQSLTSAIPGLRERFPYADGALFDRALEFDSSDELFLAVKESHESIEGRIGSAMEKREAELRERYEKEYGPLKDTPADSNAGTGGVPTAMQIAAMSISQQDEVDAKFGAGTVDKILRQAMGG